MKKTISVCIAVLFAFFALIPAAAEVIWLYPSETLPEDALRVTAHRGLSELAPENTLPAYRLAGEYGFWGAECDISQTADGVWVLMHDKTVDRMTDGEGLVSGFTYEELSALTVDAGNCVEQSPGTKVPTLTEYLDVCKEYGLHPVIEIKEIVDAENLPDLAAILSAREEKDRFVIISWGRELIAGIKALLPETPCYLIGGPGTAEDMDFCVENGVDGLDTSYNVSESVVRQAQDAGLKLMAWTVDSVTWVERMVGFGITDITTNCLVPGRAPTAEPEETTTEPTTEPASEPTAEPTTEPTTEPSSESAAEPTNGGTGVSFWQRIVNWFRGIFAVIAGWFGR
jgi:glycerophosphoryl diester phosphodiesterase